MFISYVLPLAQELSGFKINNKLNYLYFSLKVFADCSEYPLYKHPALLWQYPNVSLTRLRNRSAQAPSKRFHRQPVLLVVTVNDKSNAIALKVLNKRNENYYKGSNNTYPMCPEFCQSSALPAKASRCSCRW